MVDALLHRVDRRVSSRDFDLERFFRWRCYWDYSGGIATDLFVHLVSWYHHALDLKAPHTVLASGANYRYKKTHEVPDTLNALLQYDKLTASLMCTFNNELGTTNGLEILGTEGGLALRGGALIFTPETRDENNRWVVDSWAEEAARAYYADPKVQAVESPFLEPGGPAIIAVARRARPEILLTAWRARRWPGSARSRPSSQPARSPENLVHTDRRGGRLDGQRQQTPVGNRDAHACAVSGCEGVQQGGWRERVRRARRRRVRRFRDRCHLDAGAGQERLLELRDLPVQEELDVGIGRVGVQGSDGSESAGERGDAA